MKKIFSRLGGFVALLIMSLAMAPRASAQTVFVTPTPLHRFEVSYWDGGHLLTGVYQEGPANGYTYDPIPYPDDGLGIYVPPPGYVPQGTAQNQLIPLHRWTVIQDGWRTHYYYSIYYTEQPPDRYYNGIAGYVFSPNQGYVLIPGLTPIPLYPLSVYYSTDLGFWNGYGGVPESADPPPNRSGKDPYYFQGWVCKLPSMNYAGFLGMQFGPPGGGGGGGGNPECNPPQSSINACQHNGGWWNYEGCFCDY